MLVVEEAELGFVVSRKMGPLDPEDETDGTPFEKDEEGKLGPSSLLEPNSIVDEIELLETSDAVVEVELLALIKAEEAVPDEVEAVAATPDSSEPIVREVEEAVGGLGDAGKAVTRIPTQSVVL